MSTAKPKGKYLVTGASGRLGTVIIDTLLEVLEPNLIIAGLHNMKNASKFKSKKVETRQVDYSNKDTCKKAFEGVDKLFFISGYPGQSVSRQDQHKNVIEAAIEAKVKHLYYTSLINCQLNEASIAEDHKFTEKLLKDLTSEQPKKERMKYSIIRNNWYLENEKELLKAFQKKKCFYIPAGKSKVGWALIRDYGEGAAHVFLDDGAKMIYEFTGKPRSYKELAQAFMDASGINCEVKEMEKDEYLDNLKKLGLKGDAISSVEGMYDDIAKGCLDYPYYDLKTALDHDITPFEDSVKEVLNSK